MDYTTINTSENGMDEETEMQYREMMRKQEKQNKEVIQYENS